MTKFFLRLGLFCSTLLVSAFAGNSIDPAGSGAVILEIDGKKITLAEFEQKRPAGLFQARNTFYQAERKAVEEFVGEFLLERQAEKEHLTVAQLLDRHVNSVVPKDPPEESLRVYYEGVDTTEPYEAVRGQILDRIRQTRLARAKASYLKTLVSEAHIAIRLTPPRARISLNDSPVRGRPDAPVMIVEYADYECAYCQQVQPVLDKLETEYKEKLAFAYKDVPLPMHSHAQKASEAVHCAGKQGKYWQYHDLLFKTKELEIPKLKENAVALELDSKAFDTCLDSGEKAELVKAQLAEGQSFQLQGTPSFFINGRFFSGGLSYEQFRAVIDEELAASLGRRKDDAAQSSQ